MAFPLRRTALLGTVLAAALTLAAPGGARAATAGLHAEEIVRFSSQDADLTGGTPTTLNEQQLEALQARLG